MRPSPKTDKSSPEAARRFPRYDIRLVSRGDLAYAAFLIDHDTGETWIFDTDLSWKLIKKSKKSATQQRVVRRRK